MPSASGTSTTRPSQSLAYAVVGVGSGLAWLLLFSYLRVHRNLVDPGTQIEFFRLTEPIITLVGYGIAGLIGWFVSPGLALLDLPRLPDPVRAASPQRRLVRLGPSRPAGA